MNKEQSAAAPERYLVGRLPVSHAHRASSRGGDPSPSPGKESRKMTTEERHGARIARIKGEIARLNKLAQDCEDAVESHPMAYELQNATMDVWWEEAQVHSSRQSAEAYLERAKRAEEKADGLDRVVVTLRRDAARLRENARQLTAEAGEMQRDANRLLEVSRQSGPHKKEKEIRKRFNAAISRKRKDARIARGKAEKLQTRLERLMGEGVG